MFFSLQPWAKHFAEEKLSTHVNLQGNFIRDYLGTTTGVSKGDTRSLDYSLRFLVCDTSSFIDPRRLEEFAWHSHTFQALLAIISTSG